MTYLNDMPGPLFTIKAINYKTSDGSTCFKTCNGSPTYNSKGGYSVHAGLV